MTATRSSPSRSADRDRGSLTLFTIVIAFGLLAVAGLVIDGGSKLTAQRRADNEAEQAARAGAQAVDVDQLRATGAATLQADPARAAALHFLTGAGYRQATVTVSGNAVVVRLSLVEPTKVLGIIGVDSLSVTGVGTAELLRGVEQAQP